MITKVDIFEVARISGVSKSTVSRVLNNSYGVSETAKAKVMAAVDQLKYRPNVSARSLRSNTNNLLGILIPEELADTSIVHMVNSKKIEGIAKKVRELGYDVLIFIEDISDQERLLNIIREKGLVGVILLEMVPLKVLESFRGYNIPFVLVNWYIPDYPYQCFVKTDLARATEMGLDVLTAKGYTEIAVINWEDAVMENHTIEDAFNKYMEDRNLCHKGCIWNTELDVDIAQVEAFMEKVKKRAYLSFSYLASIRIIELCRMKKWSIPEDVALLSYEFFPFFDYLQPRLSGIRQQAELMGEKAVEKLVRMVSQNVMAESERIEPLLVLRDSC